ncbi:MAG: glycine--tRNA ligase [Candidatus Heimdallarchaeaceae archaeon]
MSSMTEENRIEKIIDVCLRRGFVNQSAEIYGGASGFFDLGPLGTLMRQKLVDFWRQLFVLDNDNIFEINGSLLLPESVFKASGHLDSFEDPLIQCKSCKSMYRADHIIAQNTGISAEGLSLEELDKIVEENKIVCPSCKGELDKARQFNLMFSTGIGPVSGNKGYLRPETAQNIFVNFKRYASFMRNKLPFGIAQVGKSFRNEISPRNFLIRVREFEQMEIELFFDPEMANKFSLFDFVEDVEINIVTKGMQEKEWSKPLSMSVKDAVEKEIIPNQVMGYFIAMESEMLQALGIPKESFWFRYMLPHETPHYSGGNLDLEVKLSIGNVEIIGNAYRTDYDLKKHEKASKSTFTIVSNNKKVLPHVVEPSMGVGRILYTILEYCYREDESRTWSWFKFPASIAPIEIAVFPLMKKDGLAEYAQDLHLDLKDAGFVSFYDDSGKIGKRYARADEIGILYCITVDYESLEKDTVTIRDRDSTKQARVPIEDLEDVLDALLEEELTFEELLENQKNN